MKLPAVMPILMVWAAVLCQEPRGVYDGEVIADGVLLRARPAETGEVIGTLRKNERVKVLGEIIGVESKEAEPKILWYRVQVPDRFGVWVHSAYVNGEGRVTATRLNVRSGPSFLYPVVGLLRKGQKVEILGRQEEWLRIKPPTGVAGYVAGAYLKPIDKEVQAQLTGGRQIGKEKVAEPAGKKVEDKKATPSQGSTEKKEDLKLGPQPMPKANRGKEARPPVPDEQSASLGLQRSPGPAVQQKQEGFNTPELGLAFTPPLLGQDSRQAGLGPQQVAGRGVGQDSQKPNSFLPPRNTLELPAPVFAAGEKERQVPKRVGPHVEYIPGSGRYVVRHGVVKRVLAVGAPGPVQLVERSTGDRIAFLFPVNGSLDLSEFCGQFVVVEGEEFKDPRWPSDVLILVQKISLPQ